MAPEWIFTPFVASLLLNHQSNCNKDKDVFVSFCGCSFIGGSCLGKIVLSEEQLINIQNNHALMSCTLRIKIVYFCDFR